MFLGNYFEFFLHKYKSNSRYTNNYFSVLKLFFDKNLKEITTLSKLGAVYKNSK